MEDSGKILLDLFVVFVCARVGGEIMARLKQPPVIGELIVGAIIGPHALGWIGGENMILETFAEVGVIFLLFEVGLENRFSDLRKVGGTAAGVAVSGVIAPMILGYGFMAYVIGANTTESLFVGAALVATSVGVTARVIGDLGLLRAIESRVILGAAVIDDVLGLLVLSVVAGLAEGGFSASSVSILLIEAVAFLGILAAIGPPLLRRHGSLLDRLHLADGPYVIGIAVCLGLAALAQAIGLAAIVGAFLAGMVFAETRDQYELERHIKPVTHFLTPYFFVLTGSKVNPAEMFTGEVLRIAGVILVIAILAKLVPCALAALKLGRKSAVIVGVGMIPRGEVGIIVATIGLGAGALTDGIYSVIVLMSVLTTIIVPPVLRVIFTGSEATNDEPVIEPLVPPGF